jgi:hypothetical protein
MKRRINLWGVLGTLLFFGLMVIGFLPKPLAEAADALKTTNQHLLATYAKLPLSFEANLGQTSNQVKFLSRGSGYTLSLTHRGEALLALRKPAPQSDPLKPAAFVSTLATRKRDAARPSSVVRMKLVGGNAKPRVEALDELPGKANYFIGNDPKKWRTNVPTYAKVKYEGVYPGVDLVYYGNQRQLEYDFVLAPGVDPNEIRLKFCGAEKLRVDEKGDLLLGSGGEEVRLEKPVVYQEVAGERKPVEGSYVLVKANRVGFQLGAYDHSQPVVIDPVLVYSTYLGGSGGDQGNGISVDRSGNIYVAGITDSSDFPTANALQSRSGSSTYDAFVTKINASGATLIYSTYLGGSGLDDGLGITVDDSGNAYVTGRTSSPNFPTTTGVVQSTCCGAFVTKINPTGSALLYSTYLGTNDGDSGNGIAVDASGNAYVIGYTQSAHFPTTTGAFQTTIGSINDNAFVAKINTTGSALLYSTYLGGNGSDEGYGIAVDASGNAYVTGFTSSTNFPTANAFQSTLAGSNNAFITKINASGSALVYSTYLGGSASDGGNAIAVDTSGNAYVTGFTSSTNFPTANAFQSTLAGSNNAFITKINASGSALVYSTYLGGSASDGGNAIAVDTSGNAYVTGITSSTNFPTANAVQPSYGVGMSDVFVTKLNPSGSALVYSTYLGGSATADTGLGIAVDGSGNAYVTGYTGSASFPTTAGAFQTAYGGQGDAFVSKIVNGGAALGGGTINVSGGLANFSFIVLQQESDRSVYGALQYVNHASGARIQGVTFTGFTIGGNTATLSGTCTNNGAPCTFNITMQGNDQLQGSDSFIISINGGPPEGGTLRRGNIEIHQCGQ